MSEEVKVNVEFLRKIGRYIFRELKNENNPFEVKIERAYFVRDELLTTEGVPTKWVIKGCDPFDGIYEMVCGDIEGKIEVRSPRLYNISFDILSILYPIYEENLKKVGKNNEKRLKLIDELAQRKIKLQNELRDRSNWDRYFSKKPFGKLMRRITWGDVAATMVTREFGVEVVHWIPPTPDEYVYFYSTFDSKGMSNDQIFDEVRKRIDAVREARIRARFK
ncbi:MAG: hypothetical protein ACPL4E_05780 [Thermoproteota archaeon]